MNANQINATFDLVAIVPDLRKAGRYHVGPCPFCGGEDRFTIKRGERGAIWHCRNCGDGKYHTPIDFIMRRENCDFKTALKILGGEAVTRDIYTQHHMPTAPASSPRWSRRDAEWRSNPWQETAWKIIDSSSERLLCKHDGELGREYLASRGFHIGTWGQWLLGFEYHYDPREKRKRPAIVIPWIDFERIDNMVVMALKYRFIDQLAKQDKSKRFTQRAGSVSVLYGLGYVIPTHHTLLLVEGEFNCISVNQCLPSGVTCLSFGSEGGGDVDVMQAIAGIHSRVFVWADDLWDNPRQVKRAGELQVLSRTGGRLRSAVEGADKFDANELLKRGALPNFLTQILGVQCLGHQGPVIG